MILGRELLVRHLLTGHTYIQAATRELKPVDPRIILAPLDGHSNDMATVTLALQTQSRPMISLVWDSYPDIFTAQHAVKFAKLAMHFSLSFTEQLLSRGEVYARLREGVDEPEEVEAIPRVFNAIKANDVGALSDAVCEFYKFQVQAGMRWKDAAEGPAKGLNPLLAAIAFRSFACVKYFMETHKSFGLRNYFQHGTVDLEGSEFSNLALPLLL